MQVAVSQALPNAASVPTVTQLDDNEIDDESISDNSSGPMYWDNHERVLRSLRHRCLLQHKIEELRERCGCKDGGRFDGNLKRGDSHDDDKPKGDVNESCGNDNDSLGQSSRSAYFDPLEEQQDDNDIVVIDPK